MSSGAVKLVGSWDTGTLVLIVPHRQTSMLHASQDANLPKLEQEACWYSFG